MFQRIVKKNKAFDKRHKDPEKNYGIHGVELHFILKGSHGASQFLLYTNRQLPHVQKEIVDRIVLNNPHLSAHHKKLLSYNGAFTKGKELEETIEWQKFLNSLELGSDACLVEPMAADIGFHSPVPLYEGHEPIRHQLCKMKFDGENFTPPVYGDPVICPYLDNDVPCYYDGSSLLAKDVWNGVITVKGNI